MADKPISALDEAVSANDGDYFVINKGDNTTKKINYARFKGDGGGDYTLPTASASTKGGVKIGTGLSMSGDVLNAVSGDSDYVLPTASASTKGGVKIGEGLSMNGEVLSVNNNGSDYTLPIASGSRLGGIKVGTGLSINSSTGVLTSSAGQVFNPIMDMCTISNRESRLMLMPGASWVLPGQQSLSTVTADQLVTKVLNPSSRGGANDIGPAPGDESYLFGSALSFQPPNGSNAAIVMLRCTVTAANGTDPLSGTTEVWTGRGLAKLKVKVENSNGTIYPGNSNGVSNASVGFSSAWPKTGNYGRRYQRQTLVKYFKITGINNGQNCIISVDGWIQDCLRYYFFFTRPTLCIFPYNTNNATASAYVDQFLADNDEVNDDIPPLDASYDAIMVQEDLMNSLIKKIQAISATREYGFQGTGTLGNRNAWSAQQLAHFDKALTDLYELRYTYSGDSNGLYARMEQISDQLRINVPEAGFRFNLTDAQVTKDMFF